MTRRNGNARPRDAERLAELNQRAATSPATIGDIAQMLAASAPVIKEAILNRTAPLNKRITALEARLAKLEAKAKR